MAHPHMPDLRWGVKRVWLVIAAATVLPSACSERLIEPALEPSLPPSVREYVEGAALASLDASGRFRLPVPVVDGPYAVISAARAEEIALGYVRTFSNPSAVTIPAPPGFGVEGIPEAVERRHGQKIEWNAVRPAAREPYFAESHLVPLPSAAGTPTIRHFGPQYLVPLYVGATPVAVVAVAVHATNIVLNDQGFIRRLGGLDGGGEYHVTGIPIQLDGLSLPPSPEAAVAFAFAQTGTRVVEVPTLGVPGNRISALGSRWKVHLASPVEFERVVDGMVIAASEVFVGLWPSIADARMGFLSTFLGLRLLVAAPVQPAVEDIQALQIPLRDGYSVDLHEVRVRR